MGTWEAFYCVFGDNGWTGQEKGAQLVAALGGEAHNCLLALPPHERTNAVALAAILDQEYGLTPYQAVQSAKLRERCRQPGGSLGVLENDIKALCERAYLEWPLSC
ncbi:UNVERIFIED_CONTAM: hypothetical protein FKN15_031022 [Acipenser sinensis]